MESSPFAKLSEKLRNHIYILALAQEERIQVQLSPVQPASHHETSYNPLISLTQTCRQIRKETSKLFYSSNVFIFSSPDDVLALFTLFRDAIGTEAASVLENVTLDLGCIDAQQFRPSPYIRLYMFLDMIEMARHGAPTKTFGLHFDLSFAQVFRSRWSHGAQSTAIHLDARRPCESLSAAIAMMKGPPWPSELTHDGAWVRNIEKGLFVWHAAVDAVERSNEQSMGCKPIPRHVRKPRPRGAV